MNRFTDSLSSTSFFHSIGVFAGIFIGITLPVATARKFFYFGEKSQAQNQLIKT
jgi:hypothetical protein